MLKPEELRIGNLVYITAGKKEVSYILRIDSDNQTISYDSDTRTGVARLDTIEGIPIDSGWLFSSGFTKETDWLYALELEEGTIFFDNGIIELALGKYSEGGFLCPHIKYVHQVQNLYFSLTGKELC